MKFTAALMLLNKDNRITRDNWPYSLGYSMGFLNLYNSRELLSPYVIHEYDFEYDWNIR